MKAGNWWVEKGLLTKDAKPTERIAEAAERFPDEYIPMVFMTGDGHRTPPFTWTSHPPWKAYFGQFAAMNKLCCHVELYPDAVTIHSVPGNLSAVFGHDKVFGWEPEFYKVIQAILEDIPDMIFSEQLSKNDIHYITKEMWRVHDLGYLRDEGKTAMKYWDVARGMKTDPVAMSSLAGFKKFLKDYNDSAMHLRVGINREIGRNIQRQMNRYSDHVHLITCGDAHIMRNPLYRYINPAPGFFGIADEVGKY